MALFFVAILIALALVHFLPEPQRLRDFSWLRSWQSYGAQQGSAGLGLAICIGLPVLLCFFVQFALHTILFGLFSLIFAVAVFAYCLGPRDLERDVEAIDKAPDTDARVAAAQALRPDEAPEPLPFESYALVESVFIAALRRVFGVIFWFVLLGPAGALLYRIASLLAYTPEHASALPAAQQVLAHKFSRALDWLPANLIALALALAADFDAVFKAWREYHAALPNGAFSANPDFLTVVARASVDADVAGGDGHVVAVHEPIIALDDAMTLIRRAAIVWIALIALVVIGGWFA